MCDLVKSVTQNSWKATLAFYKDALAARANKLRKEKQKSLIELDKCHPQEEAVNHIRCLFGRQRMDKDSWYQNELPKAIGSRKEKFITHAELCKLMTWKLTRGKFRPRLNDMVKENSEKEVEDASKRAFKKLPNLQNAIKELTVLKAVGPATASAVLAAGAPNHAAFMADESMHAIGGLQPIKYDLPFYMDYMGSVKSLVKELNDQDSKKTWTPHNVELVLWTHQILKTLAPEKLEDIKTLSENGNELSGQDDLDLDDLSKQNGHSTEDEPPKKKKKKT